MASKIEKESYTLLYVQALLHGQEVEPPDDRIESNLEAVAKSLHEVFQQGGHQAVLRTWEILTNANSSLKDLESRQPLFINANDLKDLPSPTYRIPEYPLYHNGMTVLSGQSGGGKSLVSLDIAGKVAINDDVIYCAGEGQAGYAGRWEAWKAFNEIDTDKLIFYPQPLQITNQYEIQQFIEYLEDLSPALIIIDTLARSAVGLEENSAKDIGVFVQACDNLRRHFDCALLIVHHTGKSGIIRGSSALFAAADTVIALKYDNGIISIHNDPENGGKNKYDEPFPTRYFKIQPYPIRDLKGAVLVPQDLHESEVLALQSVTDNEYLLLEIIKKYPDGIQTKAITELPDLDISTATIYRVLKQLRKYQFVEECGGLQFITSTGLQILDKG